MHIIDDLILVSTDRLNEEDFRDLIKIRDDLLEIDISLVKHNIRVVGVNAVEHQFLALNNVSFGLLCHIHRGTVKEKHYLTPTQEVAYHVGRTLLEKDFASYIFFILRVDFRLKVPKKLREHNNSERAVLFVLASLKPYASSPSILLRSIGWQFLRIKELVFD